MIKYDPNCVKRADIVIGIPSYNEADNIAFVVEKSAQGLQKYFPNYSSVIINVDNNSPDDTRGAFLKSTSAIPKIYISTSPGIKGKGNNFFNLFKEVFRLKAKAVVVIDADIVSITPEWIRDLANPILNDGFDFATPLYSRNEYDGTITNNIVYPLVYGLLGKNIRQPIGGDFAFSYRLGKYFLQQHWHKTTLQYGIDIFMTLNAIIGDFKTCQVGLGAKVHKPSAPKLGPMFSQVVGTLFEILLTNKNRWQNVCDIETLPFYGQNVFTEPQSLSVDYKTMKETAKGEFKINREILERSLSPDTFTKLDDMFDSGKIDISADLWAKMIFELIYAYDTTNSSSFLIEAMKPLYFSRVLSFYRQTLDLDHYLSEQEIQRQAKHFYNMRQYLMNRYQYQEAVAV
ncbi:MAG: glycosyltransferase [Spirochaetota bacterium]|nr:glycosyltransferase [Spirochaetota bacterium]